MCTLGVVEVFVNGENESIHTSSLTQFLLGMDSKVFGILSPVFLMRYTHRCILMLMPNLNCPEFMINETISRVEWIFNRAEIPRWFDGCQICFSVSVGHGLFDIAHPLVAYLWSDLTCPYSGSFWCQVDPDHVETLINMIYKRGEDVCHEYLTPPVTIFVDRAPNFPPAPPLTVQL